MRSPFGGGAFQSGGIADPEADDGGGSDDSDSGGGSVGSVTRDRGGAGAGGGGEPTAGLGSGDDDSSSGGGPSDPSNAPSATPAPGSDDGGRDAGDPADAPSATPAPGAAEQGVETGGAVDRVVDAAAGLEQDVVDRFPSLDGSDVRVERAGNQLTAELTESGRDQFTASPQGGDARLFTEAGEIQQGRAISAAQSGGDQRLRNQATPNIEGGDQRLFNEAAQQQRQQDPSNRPLQQEIDFSAGLGGPGDEVERAFRDTVAEPTADFFDDPTDTLPVQSAAADDSAADRAGRDFITDTSEAVGALPGQVPETAESAAGIARDLDIILRNEPGDARSAAQARNRRRLSRVAGAVDRTATNVRDDPTELAGLAGQLGVAVGVGGATGAAGRRLSGGRIGGSDLSGRIAERANEELRRLAVVEFRDSDRAQVDLSGFGRGDTDGGGGFDDDLDEALTNFEESGGTELPGDPARTSFRPEQDREADIDAADPVQQRRTQARRDDADDSDTTTGTLGLDERPARADQDPLGDDVSLPFERRRQRDADTVEDAVARQTTARQRFDQRADAIGAGVATTAGMLGTDTAATGATVADQFTATAPDARAAGSVLGGRLGTRLDTGLDADTRLDVGARTDTDTRSDTDTRTDTDARMESRTDTRSDTDTRTDTRTNLDLPTRFDFEGDDEPGDPDEERDGLFARLGDTGILNPVRSLAEVDEDIVDDLDTVGGQDAP